MKRIKVFILTFGFGSLAFSYSCFKLGSQYIDPYWRYITPDKYLVGISLILSITVFLILFRPFLTLCIGCIANYFKPTTAFDVLNITKVVRLLGC